MADLPTNDAAPEAHYLGHRERLRQKILQFGAETLQDYELLEAILMAAIPRRDVKPLAKEILQTFGSLSAALNAKPEELTRIGGIKDSTVALFALVREASIRMLKNQIVDTPVINSWNALIAYCRASMGQKKIEALRILFLDSQSRLIKDEIMQTGTINQTVVYPREVARRSMELGALSIIVVHNHPAGDLRPSKADITMTQTLRDALKPLNITLVDHLIVSKTGFMSFKDCGYL